MNSWNYVCEYYEDLAKDDQWKDFAAMEKFVKNLIANRSLSEIYAHTTHLTLVITTSEEYEKWIKEPNLFVELNFGASEEYLYKISLAETIEHSEIIRIREESVFCSFEKSLEVFDEMIKRLKDNLE